MINKTIANAAIALAEELDKRNMFLEPQVGSPIEVLVRSTRLCISDIAGVREYSPDAPTVCSQYSNWQTETPDAPSPHTQQLDAFSAEIGRAVAQHLNFTRNVVRPVIVSLMQVFEEQVKAEPVVAGYNPPIESYDLPEPLNEPSLRSAIMAFKEADAYPPTSTLNLPTRSLAELHDLLMSGQESTDAAIQTWMARVSDGFIKHVWDVAFTSEPTTENFNQLINHHEYGTDAALATFLFATKIYNDPPEGTGMTLSGYNDLIAQMRDSSAIRLIHAVEEFDRMCQLEQMLKTYTKDKITVVGPVYRNWTEKGGNVAVIYGATLTPRPVTFTGDLTERAGELVSLWERHNQMISVTQANKRHVAYGRILKDCAVRVVRENMAKCFGVSGEEGTVNVTSEKYLRFQELLDNYILYLRDEDYKDLWKLCRNLVCSVIFYYTDAPRIILEGVDEAARLNPSIQPREAALLSTIQYVTAYILDQMSLKAIT